jgi:hypothetical protein
MTLFGPQGTPIFNLYGKYRLAVGADVAIPLLLVDTQATPDPIDLSVYDSIIGAGRRERNETLTTSPLFTISTSWTSGGLGDGSDGLVTLEIDGSEITQSTPTRGYYDVFGLVTSTGARVLLVSGRWECVGGTVDPDNPA